MTQTERFVRFMREQAEREVREAEVFVRIENSALVITNRLRVPATQASEGKTAECGESGHAETSLKDRCNFDRNL
jgi:hypothetical protein